MAVIETKADKVMELVDQEKEITVKQAAQRLELPEEYVKRLVEPLQRDGLIGVKASAFSMTLRSMTG